MPGRHALQNRRGLRWLAGAAGLAVAAVTALAIAPANAAGTTTDAQLSLTGVATKANVLGGTTIGIHPGDTVNFKPSTVPTAGLENLPSLGTTVDKLLQNLLNDVLGYQVTLHFPADFPGGARDVTLGACSKPKATELAVNFPNLGTYSFTWSAVAISPLCILPTNLGSLAGNQLKTLGVALNASNQWTGQIVVANDPPAGGISVQLPQVSVAPSVPVLGQLPTIGVPAIKVPTIPVSVPKLLPSKSVPSATPTTTPVGTYTPPAPTIPEQVMGGIGRGSSGGFGGVLPDSGGLTQIGAGLTSLPTTSQPTAAQPAPAPSEQPSTHRQVQLAANNPPAAQLPVLLAIIAIIALSLVTATYARLYLLRRNI